MKWLVYTFNINKQKMETYNIFEHTTFLRYVEEAYATTNTKKEFADKLKDELRYYFWSKAEWEILISPWVGGRDNVCQKIDVYQQVILNWEVFVEYTWNTLKTV